MIRTGGGRFDPDDRHLFFLASNVDRLIEGARVNERLLLAVNELQSSSTQLWLSEWIDQGKSILLDSGIFNLAMLHAERNDISHLEAIGMAPALVDGFEDLFSSYVELVRVHGDSLWGYIELDLGGRENKIKTRAKLEDMGLRPIPVYHPFNDGWDYFDYLAQRYDRICIGNLATTTSATRSRIVATIWDRKRQHPNLWVHLLGMRPGHWVYGFPLDSVDCSSWLSAVRWSGYRETACGAVFSDMPRAFQYQLGSDRESAGGSAKATLMAAHGAAMEARNWYDFVTQLEVAE